MLGGGGGGGAMGPAARHVGIFPDPADLTLPKGRRVFFFSFFIGVFEFLSNGQSNRSPVVREGAEPRRLTG